MWRGLLEHHNVLCCYVIACPGVLNAASVDASEDRWPLSQRFERYLSVRLVPDRPRGVSGGYRLRNLGCKVRTAPP